MPKQNKKIENFDKFSVTKVKFFTSSEMFFSPSLRVRSTADVDGSDLVNQPRGQGGVRTARGERKRALKDAGCI
jgi:hypothetical protein